MIAFLGTGLLGANFVRAFRRRGEEVQVWNRTPSKAAALEEIGARAFTDPADAVRGAERIHITQSDDAAVDALLARAEAGIGKNCVIVDHTTTAPDATAERVRRWADRGNPFLHAPVFMGPANARDGTGLMLASGAQELFDALEPVLAPMTGKLVYLGPDPSRAATTKLMGNLFLLSLTAGMADMFAFGRALGVPSEEAAKMFTWWNPGSASPSRAERMSTADLTQPTFTLAMSRKDARLMLETADAHGVQLSVVPAIAAEMDRWIAAGHGNDDYMIVGRQAP